MHKKKTESSVKAYLSRVSSSGIAYVTISIEQAGMRGKASSLRTPLTGRYCDVVPRLEPLHSI